MKCLNCYKQVPDDAIFCPYCGHQVKSSDNVPKYNLNANLPEVKPLQSNFGSTYVARYKKLMGFPFNKKNILHVYQNINPVDVSKLPKRLQMYYSSEEDDSTSKYRKFILSFEDTGLLIIGIVEFIHHDSYYSHGHYVKDNSYNYHYTLHNSFIPRDKINKIYTIPNGLTRVLNVETSNYGVSFVMPRVGNKVKRVNELISQLQ